MTKQVLLNELLIIIDIGVISTSRMLRSTKGGNINLKPAHFMIRVCARSFSLYICIIEDTCKPRLFIYNIVFTKAVAIFTPLGTCLSNLAKVSLETSSEYLCNISTSCQNLILIQKENLFYMTHLPCVMHFEALYFQS